jgi:hypothetical protein
VWRWDGVIRIQAFDQYGANGALISRAFDAFNSALADTPVRLELVPVDGAVGLSIIERERWSEFAEDLDPDPNIWGWAWTYGDEEYTLYGDYILVNSKRRESERYNTLIHELFHIVAGANHASQRYDSIINQSDHSWYEFDDLGAIDRQLLRFLYLYLEPGDTLEDVKTLYDAYWRDAA